MTWFQIQRGEENMFAFLNKTLNNKSEFAAKLKR